MEPYIVERVWRMIGIIYYFKTVQSAINIIECDINRIINPLLKIGRLAKTNTVKANKKAGNSEFFQKKDFIKYKKFWQPRLIYGQLITA